MDAGPCAKIPTNGKLVSDRIQQEPLRRYFSLFTKMSS
jgi:hypothetical protein